MSLRQRAARRAVDREPALTPRAVRRWDRKARRRVKRLGPDAATAFGPADELDDIAALGPLTKDRLRLFVDAKRHRLHTILEDE